MKAAAEVLSQHGLSWVGEAGAHRCTTGLEVSIKHFHTPGMQEGILDLGCIAPR